MNNKDEEIIIVENLTKTYKLGIFNHRAFISDLAEFLKIKKRFEKIKDVNDTKSNIDTLNNEVNALSHISFKVTKGQRIALIGRNGSGKSTFLKILSRVTKPTKGKVKYKGKLISILEQGIGFSSELTALDNIYINAALLGCTKKQTDELVPNVIKFADIGDFIDTPIKRYSSGMITRLGFAIAAFIPSDILVIDEVLAVGDENFRNKCIDLIKKFSVDGTKTLIFVSHEMELIKRVCNRGILLHKGNILFDGGIEETVEKYKLTNLVS